MKTKRVIRFYGKSSMKLACRSTKRYVFMLTQLGNVPDSAPALAQTNAPARVAIGEGVGGATAPGAASDESALQDRLDRLRKT